MGNAELEPDQSRYTHQFPVASRSESTTVSTHHTTKWQIGVWKLLGTD